MKTRKSFKDLNLSNISYEPISGKFTRFHEQWKKLVEIDPTSTKRGYLRARVDGQLVMLHALAYFMMTGEDPIEIDHINRDPADNRWENIRNCNRNENCNNRSNSTNGVTIRSGSNRVKKFSTDITINGKSYYLGTYMTEEEAELVYRTALDFVNLNDIDGLVKYKNDIKIKNKISSRINYSNSTRRQWLTRKK